MLQGQDEHGEGRGSRTWQKGPDVMLLNWDDLTEPMALATSGRKMEWEGMERTPSFSEGPALTTG